jgi:hypothetical protein
MAKLSTIQVDENGEVVRVTHSDLPPSQHPPPVKKRIPSSPHKPLTTRTFYDLTQSETPSPVQIFDKRDSRKLRELQQMERENIVPGPFSHGDSQTKHRTQDTHKTQDSSTGIADRPRPQGIRKSIHD